jgi:Family of unknown function (DUF5689)
MQHSAKLFRSVLLCVFSVFLINDGFSQVLTTNTFTGSTGTCPTQGNTFSAVPNATVAVLSRNTITCSTAGNVFNSVTLNNTASRNDNSYIEFSITANTGFGLNLTSLSFFRQGSNTAPNSLIVSYSTDANAANFNTTRVDMAVSTTTNPGTNITWTFPSAITTVAGGKVTFRFYPYGTVSVNGGAAATTGAFRLDDVTLNGTVVNASPNLTATPSSITNLNYISGNGPSTAGTYNLSGSVLSGSPDFITVTAPTNFEVSRTSATMAFGDTVKIAYSSATLASTPIYVRLKAGLTDGNYSGNVTHSGGGVTSPPTVAVSGAVTNVPPPIVTTTGTLSTFNTIQGTPSASQSYTVSGSNLVSDITITAPTDFEIKTGAGVYANTLNLTPTSGSVSSTTIDVRLKGTTAGTFTGNLVHSATNLSPNVNVAVNGVVGVNCGTAITIASVRSTIPAQQSYTGTAGTIVEGKVTGIFGNNKFYVQDATGGIAVFFTNVVTTNGLALGDQVKMTGTPVRFNGESQINTLTCIVKVSSGTVPAPIVFDANNPPSGVDLNTFLANNEGSLIKIISANVVSSGTFTASTNYTTIACNSQGGTEIRVDAGSTTLIGSTIPSVTQDITAIIGHFINATGTDKLQIFPRNAADLSNSSTTCTISGGCGVTTFTDSPTQLDVFNWNIEWIGHPSNGPSQSGTNDATQIANAQAVLNGVGADFYSLQEICQYNAANPEDNTTAFGKLIQGLNNTFGVGTYSGECSAAVSSSVADPNPQRVCVIYKNSVVTKVFSRPMFDGFTPSSYPPTGTPSQFWASGRKPFEFMAKVNINNKIDTILFVNLHAKSGSATVDYNRRKFDVKAMYDTLQAQFPNRKTVVLGDLNDDVDRSIASTSTNPVISSYSPFLYADPNETQLTGTRPNADWSPISKTLSDAFCASTASFPDYIDHQIVSNEMVGTSSGYRYVPASVTSFRPVVANYSTTTSDHYPTIARFEYITPPIVSIVPTGNWSSPSTWSCNCVPTSADDVVIETGHTITVDAASQAKSLNLKGTLNYISAFTLSLGM